MKALFLLGMVLTSQMVFAHGDHKPPPKVAKCAAEICTKKEISDSVQATLETVVQVDKKRSGWSSAKFVELKEQKFEKGSEWVMSFSDPSKPTGEQTMYVFVTLKGYLNGSNFSGK